MNFGNMFGGMFGKLAPDTARLSVNGKIAIKTTSGYKTYSLKTGNLTNCANFVFPGGEDMFFVIPTNKVAPGDIILVSGKPKCVVSVSQNQITVVNYENGTIENVIPERHVFMGNVYFYGKIVSMFGNIGNGKNGSNKIMKYMMMSEMMKGGFGGNGMNSLLPMMMLSGSAGNIFEDMFDSLDFDADIEDEAEETEAEDEEN